MKPSNSGMWQLCCANKYNDLIIMTNLKSRLKFKKLFLLIIWLLIYLTTPDVATAQEIMIFEHHSETISSVAFSPDGKQALSGSWDKTLKFWDMSTGRMVRTFVGYSGPVESIAFSPDGKQILSRSGSLEHHKDAALKRWVMETGQELPTFEGLDPFFTSIAFSPNGERILSKDPYGYFKLQDTETGQEIQAFTVDASLLNSVAFSPNGNQILLATDDIRLRLWDATTGQEVQAFTEHSNDYTGHGSTISSLAFSPSGKQVLSGSQDGTFKLWDVTTGQVIRTFDGHSSIESVAFSPDGKKVISGGWNNALKLWDVTTGQVIRSFTGHSGNVQSVAFSPNGKNILSGSADGTTRIWDVASGQLVITMLGSPDGEWSINTPDGYYDTSPEGKNLVHYAFSRETYSFEQFEPLLHRPDIIKTRLAGNLQAGSPAPQPSIPPSVKAIGIRSFSTTVDSATYPLTVVVSSPAGTVKTVRVFVNGKATNEQSVESREKRLDLQIPLFAGPNHIAVLAYDERGFSSHPESLNVVSTASGRKPTLYAMGIGVDTYPNLPGKNLEYAVSDAKRLVQSLQAKKGKIFADVKDLILTNQEATPEAIQKGLETFAAAMDTNDVAVIFLAGHGIKDQTGKFWFVTSQGSADNLRQGGLNWDILDQYISKMRGRVILLLDSCHSGSIIDATVVPNDELAARFFKGQAGGVMVFSAAKGRQLAKEGSQFGGGLFTYALTQGLGSAAREVDRENKGYVSFMDLVDYVSKYVNKESKGGQTPWLSRRELFGDIPIGAY